ncbi:phosphatase [Ligilactobacillus pabuli]|uniref:Phosphatase n=1 Tax=Ligilactobacillus pabuli TaxID=2886039 RepID=A0ABQ5JGL7_9LACO|nr:HAD family hydrolase [Ligilactobacillus pabuli]GKS81219.1 phosphatase [Ligilactobacillus pabuli]
MTYKNLIFDIDGTLIDTQEAVLQTWQTTLREYGYDFSLDQLQAILGIPLPQGLEQLAVNVDQDYQQRWNDNYAKEADKMFFFAGIEDVLQQLQQTGVNIGVVTSRSQDELDQFFKDFELEKIFPVIITADDTKLHKPEPEPLEKYLKQVGAAKEDCIYIGDMPTDILCAQRAGMTAGLVNWSQKELSETRAEFVFLSPQEMLAI